MFEAVPMEYRAKSRKYFKVDIRPCRQEEGDAERTRVPQCLSVVYNTTILAERTRVPQCLSVVCNATILAGHFKTLIHCSHLHGFIRLIVEFRLVVQLQTPYTHRKHTDHTH